jgi:hypothetical protein
MDAGMQAATIPGAVQSATTALTEAPSTNIHRKTGAGAAAA